MVWIIVRLQSCRGRSRRKRVGGILGLERAAGGGGLKLLQPGVAVPPDEPIPRAGHGRQRTAGMLHQDEAVASRTLQGPVDQRAPHLDGAARELLCAVVVDARIEDVGEAMGDAERPAEPARVGCRDRIDQAGVRLVEEIGAVFHPVACGSGPRSRELVGVLNRRPVQTQRGGIPLLHVDADAQGQVVVAAFDFEVQRAAIVLHAVSVDRGLLQIVPYAEDVGGYARVDFVVAPDRDVEGVARVGPDVEIRGGVLPQIDAIGQHLLAARRADQEIGGVLGGVIAVLQPWVDDGGIRPLRVGRQVKDARGPASRKHRAGRVRVAAGRGHVVVEERGRLRHGAHAHRVQLDVGGRDGDVVGHLRDPAAEFERREFDGGSLRRAYRRVEPPRHRQVGIVGGVGNGAGRQLCRREVAHVAVHVGDGAERVVARRALEAQGRGALVAVQNDGPGLVAEVEVQIADGGFIRQAGRGRHALGAHGQPNVEHGRKSALLLRAGGASPEARQCRQQGQYQ